MRPILVMALVVLNATAAVFCLLGRSSWSDLGWAAFLVVVFTPVKGVTYRRLGGWRPFLGALVGSFTWQAVGLPIDLDSFWIIIGASFVVSTVVEALALMAMQTAPLATICLLLALYGTTIVHLLITGFFLFQRNAVVGVPTLIIGTLLFLLPAFFSDRFLPDAP